MSTGKIVIGAVGVLGVLLITAGQFTTINTGENGLYTSFDGKVKNEVLTPGIKYDGFVLREAMKNGSIQKILINGAPILSLSDKDFVMAK